MTDVEEPVEKLKDRDTFVLGVERKRWIKERSDKLGLGKSEYIRRLIDEEIKKVAEEPRPRK